MKGGRCDGDPSRLCRCPPFRLCGGRVEWRGRWCVLSPSSVRILPFALLPFPLCCLVPLVLWVVGGEVRWAVLSVLSVTVLCVENGGGVCHEWRWGTSLRDCVLFSPFSSPFLFVFAVTALLVWWCVFVTGLCHCGIAVMVCVGAEERYVMGVWSRRLSSLPSPFLLLLVLVFGVVRAQPCEHARYPRTPIVFPWLFCLLFSSLLFALRLSSSSVFPSAVEWRWVRSPCVSVLCWHNSNREPVSFVLVFLVVACSSFASPSVASSAVAFGAEDSAVVWVIGSA